MIRSRLRWSLGTVLIGSALVSGCSDDAGGLPGPGDGSFTPITATDVAGLAITPFDVDREDLVGPDDHNAQYGKLPEIVASPGDRRLDLALRSFEADGTVRALVLRFEDAGSGLALTRALAAPNLDLLLGFVAAPDGGFYYATATDDPDVSPTYPAEGAHRANVARVYRVDPAGAVVFDVDLDPARAAFDADAEPLINPGVASSARLGLAGGQLALVAGNNTAPDAALNGTRHQKAVTTLLAADTGAITAVHSIWCSHSFDQRYLADGADLYELHLGDAYPREVVVTRLRGAAATDAIGLYHPKGDTGANNTFTRLGGIAPIASGPGAGGALALFATERTLDTAARVNGSRDLALVRTVADFTAGPASAALDPSFGTTFDVMSGGDAETNRVRWLTRYHEDAPGMRHAERPKLLALGGGEFLILWEQWSGAGATLTFDGTFAARVDGNGEIQAAATQVATNHLPRGDDAFVYGGAGCWVTGDATAHTLALHCVDRALAATHATLP